MNFNISSHNFFIHKSGQPYIPPDECINCNLTYNNLTKTFILHLYNVTMDNNGTYELKFKPSNDDNGTKHQIHIYVRELPVLSTSDVSSLEFTNLTLNCSINSDWFDKIWWTTSNGSIINSCNRSRDHFSQTCHAVLSNVTRKSQDVYTCHAENPTHYNISKTISLDIVYGPRKSIQLLNMGVSSPFFNITVKEGDILNISCTADCNPNCNYTWNTNESNGSFLNVKANRKFKGFTCTAENQYGSDKASVSVNVLYASGITNIKTLNEKTTFNETDNITIQCTEVGNPKPSIIWSKNGEVIKNNYSDHFLMYDQILKSEESRSGHLLIQSSGCNATGNYSCTSCNGKGNDSKSMSINVNCKPTILRPKENLKDHITSDSVFEVLYEAYPAPKFKWTFLAENGNKDEDITSSFLVVNRADAAFRFRSLLLLNRTYTGRTGHYRIDIWNFLGHASRQIYIQDHKVVRVNVYLVIFLPILCFVLPIYIVVMCKICMRKRRSAIDNIAEERRSELSGIQNVYVNRVREIELAALRPYEDLSINVEISAYDDINERRGMTNPRDHARANLNEQGSTNSSASGRDTDEDGYLNMKEQDSPAICIRKDPNEPDSTGGYVSGADKDADGYLTMKGQNIPNFCKRCDTKLTGSIENKQCLEEEGYIQMEAPSARKSKEKASDENKNTNSEM